MGKRKRESAERRKEAMKSLAFAKLNDCPTSPRKMRLVADMIRGKHVEKALNALKFSTKEAAGRMEKVLLSAINNWQSKNETLRIEDQQLFVSDVYVDSGTVLKRLRTAPQGRGHRILKRSNHVTLVLGNKAAPEVAEPVAEETEEQVEAPEATEETEVKKAPETKKKTAKPKAAAKKKTAKKPAGKTKSGSKEEKE